MAMSGNIVKGEVERRRKDDKGGSYRVKWRIRDEMGGDIMQKEGVRGSR